MNVGYVVEKLMDLLPHKCTYKRGEADHSPLSGIEVKNAWSYTSTTARVFMA